VERVEPFEPLVDGRVPIGTPRDVDVGLLASLPGLLGEVRRPTDECTRPVLVLDDVELRVKQDACRIDGVDEQITVLTQRFQLRGDFLRVVRVFNERR